MAAEITHVRAVADDGTVYMRQIVSAARLRQILRRDGESTERPRGFGERDEWVVVK